MATGYWNTPALHDSAKFKVKEMILFLKAECGILKGGRTQLTRPRNGGGMRGNEGGRKENSRTFSTINCHKVLLPPLARARGQLIGDGRGKVAISDPPVSICRSLILTASLYFSCKVNIQMTISHLILLVSNSCSVLLDSILSLDRKIIQDYIRLYLVSLF